MVLGAIAIVSIIAISADVWVNRYLSEIESGSYPDEADTDRAYSFQLEMNVAQTLLSRICVVSFLIWFHRVHNNLTRAGLSGLRFTPQWAVAGFVLPLINFVRPYQVMAEVWQKTTELRAMQENQFAPPRSNAIIRWWWGSFLAMAFASFAALILGQAADLPMEFLISGWVWFVSDVFVFLAAIAAILVVWRITWLQEEIRNRK